MNVITDTRRKGCDATAHGTSHAYKKHGCRCETAKLAERNRKAQYDRGRTRTKRTQERRKTALLNAHISAGYPSFSTDARARCTKQANPDVMFPTRAHEIPAALAVCTPCPLKTECLRWAVEKGEIYGVWGSVTEEERRAILLKKTARA